MRAARNCLGWLGPLAGLVLFVLLVSFILPASAATPKIQNPSILQDITWIDEFNSSTLDPRWNWINEDPTHWSLSENPGYLRIVTQPGTLSGFEGDPVNVLLTTPELENYTISTKVTFAPSEYAQWVSLLIYQDAQNYIELSRRYVDDDHVLFRAMVDGNMAVNNTIPESATTIYLRISKMSDYYSGAYSLDGLAWTKAGTYYGSFSNPEVGLHATKVGAASEVNADFDYFRMDKLETVYVAGDGDCGAESPCYTTLQAAVDASDDDGVIKVAAGTYTDLHDRPRNDAEKTGTVTQIVYLDKNLSILGGYAPSDWTAADPLANPTILDAGGAGRVVYASGDIFVSLDGLQIRNGQASGLGGFEDLDAGGGIYVITTTLELHNSLITGNQSELGGGAFFYAPGGGLVQNSRFESNSADSGGGLALRDRGIDLIGNVFQDNQAVAGEGGAVNFFGSNSNLYNNRIIANTATGEGGGLSMGMFDGILNNNLIMNNSANNDGGGISVFGGNTWTNNVIVGNHANGSAGAIAIKPSGPILVHTTIAGNTSVDGTAIIITEPPFPVEGDIQILNSIIAGQPTGVKIVSGSQSLTIDHVLWHGVTTEVDDEASSTVVRSNEQTGDPAFRADGYHLSGGSAALDWGMDLGTITDIDGEARPNNGYDLGADEFWPKIYLPITIK